MARRARDPSGAAVNASIRLSPAHLDKLKRLAEARGLSPSQTVERLLDRVREEDPVQPSLTGVVPPDPGPEPRGTPMPEHVKAKAQDGDQRAKAVRADPCPIDGGAHDFRPVVGSGGLVRCQCGAVR